jgi:integrase
MARRVRSSSLETRSARLKLKVRGKPYWQRINEGLSVGYRRNASGSGSWSMRAADGRGGNWIKVLAPADDFEGTAGAMSFWEAQRRAVELHRGGAADDHGRLATVAEAITAYKADLKARGGEIGNVSRIEYHMTPSLRSKPVATLNARELRHWRDGLLAKGLAPGSVVRCCKSLAAALSLCAAHDPRVQNRNAWRVGLAALPDASKARNVVLPDDKVRAIVAVAYQAGAPIGTLIEILAVTGCRPIQAWRLTIADVQKDRLLLPSSLKGKGKKRIERRAVPIPANLATRLKQLGRGRDPDDLLLLKANGEPWAKSNLREPFREIAERVGLDPDKVTPYALRHSWIASRLVRGLPVKLIADAADTSPAMIQQTYGRYIPADHTDQVLRSALIDLSEPKPNVVTLAR